MTTSAMWRLGTAIAAAGGLLAAVLGASASRPIPASEPSPWYIYDGADIQYFAPGPEFKLSREAAAQKAYQADLQAQQGVVAP